MKPAARLALALAATAAVAAAFWRLAARAREGYEAKYTTRVATADGGYKCPDGYSDTGKDWRDIGGEKQCRKKATGKDDANAKRFMRAAQRRAKEQCGARPPEDNNCSKWKCRKFNSGLDPKYFRYRWTCAQWKSDQADPCSTVHEGSSWCMKHCCRDWDVNDAKGKPWASLQDYRRSCWNDCTG